MTDFRDSVVRLVNRVGDRPSWGSGIFVSPSLVLTAAHVVAAPHADGRTPAPREQIEIESAGFSGRQRPDFIEFAKASDIDLALLSLRAPKGVSPDFVARVNAEPLRSINIGDEVTACGFASIDGARQTDRLRVLRIHGNAGALICNKAVPEGYSGGPIFADGLLVGIMYARNLSQGQSYFHGGQALMEVLNAYARELSLVRDAPSPLRAYPLTPGYRRKRDLDALGTCDRRGRPALSPPRGVAHPGRSKCSQDGLRAGFRYSWAGRSPGTTRSHDRAARLLDRGVR
jgi:hypothetical protein